MSESRDGNPGVSRRTVLAGAAATTAGAVAAAVSADDQASVRGSDQLLEKAGAYGHKFSAGDLREVIAALGKQRDSRIIDWCQYGQPDPDGFCGTVSVPLRLAPGVIGDLLAIRNLSNWRVGVFPKGTPIPDLAHITVNAGRVSGGVIVHG
jgi:hypothetical protein